MKIEGLIFQLPREIKMLIAAFCIVLSLGFFSGLMFVNETSSLNPSGIEENYLGNESDEEPMMMKFEKSEREMLSIIHSHILSMSVIFLLVGIILSLTKINMTLKLFLLIEPFVSVILTFGGLFFLWKKILWMKYIVMFSGILMTISFLISIMIILFQLLPNRKLIENLPEHSN